MYILTYFKCSSKLDDSKLAVKALNVHIATYCMTIIICIILEREGKGENLF